MGNEKNNSLTASWRSCKQNWKRRQELQMRNSLFLILSLHWLLLQRYLPKTSTQNHTPRFISKLHSISIFYLMLCRDFKITSSSSWFVYAVKRLITFSYYCRYSTLAKQFPGTASINKLHFFSNKIEFCEMQDSTFIPKCL